MQAHADLAGAAAAVVGDPMCPRTFQVVHRRRDTHDTWTLWLEPQDGVPLRFTAGQFTMLHAFGVGEVPISISGDPTAGDLLQHTIRDIGGVTHALAAAEPGDTLGVRGAFGHGWEVGDGAGGDVLLVAGGIGLAPLRPALLEVLARRAEFRRVVLLYGARSPEELLYEPELESWRGRLGLEVGVTVDQAEPTWRGQVGLVTELIPRAALDPERTLALVCGPELMMRYVGADLCHVGVPADRVRLSMERNMKCGVGLCGHCQLRELFLCVDGPVLPLDCLVPLMATREL
ncbi:MAG: FAD/NAD(P)-binding protein [Actinomycetes bacterium]